MISYLILPHSLRHTHSVPTTKCRMNPKALQYIMGHANIAMTLVCAHATFDSCVKRDEATNKEKQQERLVVVVQMGTTYLPLLTAKT